MKFATIARNRNSERLIALVSAVVVLISIMAIYAAPARAHNGTVSWDCDGWVIDLNAYSGATVDIVVDGQVVADTSFQSSYDNSGTWDDTQNHTLQIVVNANDDNDQPVYDLGSNGSFSPDWPNGEYSFTLNITQTACNQPPQTVTAVVAAGSCQVGGNNQASGSVDVTITPASGATVNVYSNPQMTNLVGTLTATGSIDDLGPGTYYWSATPAQGFTLTGPSSGQVTIVDCEVSVTVVAGPCVVAQGQASGTANVTIDPDSAATVNIYSDAAMNDLVTSVSSSGTVTGLTPGTYYWDADAAAGFDFSGPDSGQFTVAPCEVTVGVTGACVLNGDAGSGELTVTISVPNGATVEITDSTGAVVGSLTASGTVTVPEGASYSWTATPASGFTIDGPSSGTVDIEECTRSIDVVVNGVCDANVPVLSWEVTPVNFSASDVTITWNDIDPSDPLYSSTQPLSGSMVWPGTVIEDGAAVDWAGWLFVDGEWVQGADGYENTRPSASITFSVNPQMTLDVVYPGGEPTCDGPPGEIIVEKVVLGPAGQDVEFDFDTTNFTLGDSSLAHGQSSSSGPLFPGSGYAVSEQVPGGWTLVSAVCDDGSDPADIDLAAGETVTCTFTNQIEDSVLASIQVTVGGECEVDGDEGEGVVEVTMSVPNGARVVLRDSDGDVVGSASSDTTITVPEGETYTWEAIPNEGFSFPPGFDSTGTISIETCSNPETLPFTGLDLETMAVVATVLLGTGSFLVAIQGRREES